MYVLIILPHLLYLLRSKIRAVSLFPISSSSEKPKKREEKWLHGPQFPCSHLSNSPFFRFSLNKLREKRVTAHSLQCSYTEVLGGEKSTRKVENNTCLQLVFFFTIISCFHHFFACFITEQQYNNI